MNYQYWTDEVLRHEDDLLDDRRESGDERTEAQRKADEAERDWWEEARADACRGW